MNGEVFAGGATPPARVAGAVQGVHWKPGDLMDVMDWIGWDRLMFASDYPHWDFDDPHFAIPPSFGEERRRRIFSENASRLYGLS